MNITNSKPRVMWAVQHTPSGSWHNGDATLTLYPFEHEARIACGKSDAFTPVKVKVQLHD